MLHSLNEEQVHIEHLKFTITLQTNLQMARHEYEYTLKNFGDDPDENSFYFTVPNAKPHELEVGTVDDSDRHKPSLQLVAEGKGTRLEFQNLSAVAQGQPKTLRFEYTAPTSAFLYSGYLVDVAFYRADLIHEYKIDQVTVVMQLPGGSKLIKHVGEATITGTTITFIERNLNSRESYSYPIFFSRRKRVASILLAVGALLLGAVLDQIASGALGKVWNLFFGK